MSASPDSGTGNPGAPVPAPFPTVWTAQVITLLPEVFPGVLGTSNTGAALAKGLWALRTIDLREFGVGRHRTVDGTPAGGGAGMVMRPDVAAAALDHALGDMPRNPVAWPLICLSPRGEPFCQQTASRLSSARGATFLCGRFEGIDERVVQEYGLEEVSVGDFVMTGGEIAAMALIDAAVRLIPRVLGNSESVEEESFSSGLLEYPQYTRPTEWRGRRIPDVLLSGHHAEIARWRRSESERLTSRRRPDLLGADRAKGP